jgi:hypothetical protein
MRTQNSSTNFGRFSTKTKFKVSTSSAFSPWKLETNKIEILSAMEANFYIIYTNGNIQISTMPEKVDEN